MKNWNVFEWVFFILSIAIAYIITFMVTAILMSKMPTTPENEEIRGQVIELISSIAAGIMAVIIYKFGASSNNKNENK